MELIIHQREDISLVALAGSLDATGVEEVEQAFGEATSARGLPTVVDLSGITFISSIGIGFLFDHTRKLKKSGCKLVLLNPQGMVDDVLKTSKMTKVMPVHYEFEDAVEAVGGDPTISVPESPAAAAPADDETKSASAPQYAPDNVLKLSIKNQMSELQDLYAKVNQFLQSHNAPHRSGYAINLALEELIVNVIRYAFIDDDEHTIDIGLGFFAQQIVLEIKDTGEPFDPREAPPHDPNVEDLQVGGLGLTLVLDMVNELTYRRENDANHVRVCVHIQEEELSGAANDDTSGDSAAAESE